MKPSLFIDTSAWIALDLARDRNHATARAFWTGPATDFRWFTTTWVFSEVLTLLRRRASHEAAIRFGARLRASNLLEVIRVESQHEERAWEIFSQFADKDFGCVDCTSFAVMESRAIRHAFTYDRHFEQMGYQRRPRT